MNDPTKNLIVVVGPTAVGKTDLCVRLAKQLGAEIISADARQFFREMNIGTAKPSLEERGGVSHHLINSHSIVDSYNAGDFERDALQILEQLYKHTNVAIVTGGSGLYIKALCEGMDEMPEIEESIREQLNTIYMNEGLPVLLSQLDQLDPEYAASVDRANPQRIIRALEVCLASGKPYSSFRKKSKAIRPFRFTKIGLQRNREELYARIDARMDAMLAEGLVEEVKRLQPYRMQNALQTVGYTEVFDFLDGKYDETEMIRLLKRNSRRYAKRQITWFSRDPEIRWFHPSDYTQIIAYIQQEPGAMKPGT
ncbi:tRNA (adenosine(37)-N6)-dimethylallyltransferase MiaA [Rhodocytophaga rosea]|uniref:tRNA dimethylallyltransferase n=1 Tax=Rhodocytophaga rosea TaxID=2704465 RepID=A0A6C0GRV0_9BACT|nr:tRNA (adenosine(37)-N6)-dimethylallyltransferase MiaA [Rhodocytophaga rosea]QHT70272.1 tRNA (adenosine(37)-N6)-dimethylallyltransferase MiaA [Rhodocytophaga rosea]